MMTIFRTFYGPEFYAQAKYHSIWKPLFVTLVISLLVGPPVGLMMSIMSLATYSDNGLAIVGLFMVGMALLIEAALLVWAGIAGVCAYTVAWIRHIPLTLKQAYVLGLYSLISMFCGSLLFSVPSSMGETDFVLLIGLFVIAVMVFLINLRPTKTM